MINDQNINSINKTLLHVGDSKPINKRSLVSRSGKQFESIDHYIAESLIQNFYPKNNKDDFELVKEDDSSLPPNYKKNEEDEEKKQSKYFLIFSVFFNIFFCLLNFISRLDF